MHTLALLITSLWLSTAASQQATPPQQSPQPQNPQPQNPQQPTPQQPKPAEQKPGDPKKPADKDAAKTPIPPEKLEQLVAPIALYPDGLLSQTLMASTYPLEIVQASRWLQKNPNLKPDALEKALQDQTWDPSVKSLCGLPTILNKMNENLDWTQDLGDAFLADQSALMDTVQKMRRKAKDAGKLDTTKEQKVSERDDKIIVIEPADPQTVYVPTYYPTAVYGGWSYPVYYYPPMYPAYPPAYPAFTFAVGVAWGAAIWGGCHWGWGSSNCNVNINNFNNFTGRTENNFNRDRVQNRPAGGAGGGRGSNNWQHSPEHRGGVRYGDNATAKKFNNPSASDRSARGYGQNRAGTGSAGTGSAGTRPAAGTRPSAGTSPSAGTRPSAGASQPKASQPKASPSSGQRSGSFSGSNSASSSRAASSRGSSSRGGGGGRSGGGGRGGGGRR